MLRTRIIQATFTLVCNNRPIVGYPISLLYTFRAHSFYEDCCCIQDMHNKFAKARLFYDIFVIKSDIYWLSNRISVTVTSHGYRQKYNNDGLHHIKTPRGITYSIGEHIPLTQV